MVLAIKAAFTLISGYCSVILALRKAKLYAILAFLSARVKYSVNVKTACWDDSYLHKFLIFSLSVPYVPFPLEPGRAIGRAPDSLSQRSWVRYPVWQHTFISPSAFTRRAVVSYWRKYAHEVLVNSLGGLSLPRKSVVRLTDRPDMTLDVYRGRETIMQQQQQFATGI